MANNTTRREVLQSVAACLAGFTGLAGVGMPSATAASPAAISIPFRRLPAAKVIYGTMYVWHKDWYRVDKETGRYARCGEDEPGAEHTYMLVSVAERKRQLRTSNGVVGDNHFGMSGK